MIDKCLYLERGWKILPLAPNTKVPMLPSAEANPAYCPQVFRERQPSLEELMQWEGETTNYGIFCGRASGLIIIDVDTKEGLDLYKTFRLPKTLTAVTRKGYHFYFQYPSHLDPALVEDWVRMFPEGIDRRGDKFYAVAPPSTVMSDGKLHTYTWLESFDRSIIALPDVFLRAKPKKAAVTAGRGGWIGEALKELKDGNRDNTLFQICSRLRRDGYSEDDAMTLLEPHAAAVDGLDILSDKIKNVWSKYAAEPKPVLDATVEPTEQTLAEYDSVLERRATFVEPELPTGFKSIDDLTDGYQRGDVLAVGAWTGGGKSTFLVNSINTLCQRGKRVLYLSTEMSRFQIYDKLFSLNTGIPYRNLRKGQLGSADVVAKDIFRKNLMAYRLLVNDGLRPTAAAMRAMVLREKPDLIVLDHIHQLSSEYSALSELSKELKQIALDFNCAVAIAVQFSRPQRTMDPKTQEVKLARRPTLYDIKACGDIENILGTAILLYDTGESLNPDVNAMAAAVEKCRHGDKGLTFLDWHWRTSKMADRNHVN